MKRIQINTYPNVSPSNEKNLTIDIIDEMDTEKNVFRVCVCVCIKNSTTDTNYKRGFLRKF